MSKILLIGENSDEVSRLARILAAAPLAQYVQLVPPRFEQAETPINYPICTTATASESNFSIPQTIFEKPDRPYPKFPWKNKGKRFR